MWAATQGPGRWLRAGTSGSVAGLDVDACMRLPSLAGLDADVVEELLAAIEQGAMVGMAKHAKDGE